MNSYQSHQEMIRLFRQQLLSYQVKSIVSLSIGISCIIATPLIANTFTIRDKIINASGFISGLASIGYCLIINPKLRELEGKNIMINKLEKELFIDEQMSLYNQFRQPNLQPTIEVQPQPQPQETLELTDESDYSIPPHPQCECGSSDFVGHGSNRIKCKECGKTQTIKID